MQDPRCFPKAYTVVSLGIFRAKQLRPDDGEICSCCRQSHTGLATFEDAGKKKGFGEANLMLLNAGVQILFYK